MATIIDSLIVTLSLDKGKFDKHSADAKKEVAGLKKEGEDSGRKISEANKKTSESFVTLTKAAGGFFAALVSSKVVNFVTDLAHANAATSRLAQNLNVGVKSMTAWGNAAEQMGGDSNAIKSAFSAISKSQYDIMTTGSSALIPYFNRLGVSLVDSTGSARSVTDVMLQLAHATEGMNRQMAYHTLKDMGFDDGTVNLLLKGRAAVESVLAEQEKYNALSEEQAKAAEKLDAAVIKLKQTWAAFAGSLASTVMPYLETAADWLRKVGEVCQGAQGFIEKLFAVMAAGVAIVKGSGLIRLLFAIVTRINPVIAAVTTLSTAIAALWDDFSVWKEGGDSFIDWGAWKEEIDAVIAMVSALRDIVLDVVDRFKNLFSNGNELVKKTAETAAKVATGEKSVKEAAVEMAGNVATAFKNGVRILTGKSTTMGQGELVADSNEILSRKKAQAAQSTPVSATQATPAKPTRGTAASRQQEFMNELIARGWTKEQAAGLAGNARAESDWDTKARNAENGGEGAHGLMQWRGDRLAHFRKVIGKNPWDASVAEQAQFVDWELRNTERGAGKRLAATTNAAEAGAVISKYYERHAEGDKEHAKRAGFAQAAAAQYQAGATNTTTTNNTSTASTQIGSVTVVTQATDPKGVADEISHRFNVANQGNMGLT